MRGEHHRIVVEFDDVDLFAAQFANDRLHAHALHADAGADAIHVAVAAGYGDLGALAGFARAAFDHHGVVVNLGNFLLEQAHHQFRRGARNDHARVLAGLLHALDHAADAVAHAEAFQRDCSFLRIRASVLPRSTTRSGPSRRLTTQRHQLADAAGEFRKDVFALGFAHLLQNHLLGGLRRDPAQRIRWVWGSGFLRRSRPPD